MDELNDEVLVCKIGQGDRGAFLLLYGRYRTKIYSYLIRRLGDAAIAEELCQEVFIGLLKAAPKWEPRAKVSTYLFRIASNQASKTSRRSQKNEFQNEESSMEQSGPEHQTFQQERANLVRKSIEKLAPEQRDVLLLHQYQGLSYAEIAEVLDIPVGTVRSRISRAKAFLREDLRGILSFDGGVS